MIQKWVDGLQQFNKGGGAIDRVAAGDLGEVEFNLDTCEPNIGLPACRGSGCNLSIADRLKDGRLSWTSGRIG